MGDTGFVAMNGRVMARQSKNFVEILCSQRLEVEMAEFHWGW